ncbi:hypothetical protein PCANC_03248 [Puccinia coronata f. sp. avenae]|uniref:Uncharacterized protein n=1 Tax=Puccinia coronata f. sp. avenae TaxID=200324 RepID=A0A2N5VZ30_9BASI|nr:hypothetical protein PCASD_18974 [Puccinia coronata f. sp. avenae]PLW55236.1 hypothetical protein PCANC_03248 [Puccinia coronata f. sp. avenae]
MPPKRRANNNHKKRRTSTKQHNNNNNNNNNEQLLPEGNATDTGTPHTSPSKTGQQHTNDSSPTLTSSTPLSQPLLSTPDHHHQADLDHASKLLLHPPSSSSSSTGTSSTKNSNPSHQSLSSKTSLPSSAKSFPDSSTTLTERSTNLPDSTASYPHPNSTNEVARPASNSGNKHASSATHGRTQDPGVRGENQTHPGSTPKSDTKKTPQLGSHAHVVDLVTASHDIAPEKQTPPPQDDHEPSAHDSRAHTHNGLPKEPSDEKMEYSESEQISAVKEDEKIHTSDEISVKEDHSSSKSESPTAAKKPAKHVKFTSTTDPAQSSHFPSAAEGPQAQKNHRKQRRVSKREEGESGDDERGGGKQQHKAIRREMSGAADAFDFDAQQRLHAGPGGGLVKKARHRGGNGHQSSSGEWSADEAAKDSAAEPPQHAALSPQPVHADRPARKDGRGFQHAQRSLRAAMAAQRGLDPAPPHHHEDDDMDPGLVQMYLSFFDMDQDGLLAPLDSWRAFLRLGFGVLYAAAAALTLHALITFLGLGAPDLWGRVRLPLAQLRHPGASRYPLHVHPHNLLDVEPGRACEKVGPRALWKKTQTHMGAAQMTDPVGWIKFLIGWMVAVGLTWPTDLSVNPALINGVYNGELLFIVADQAKS